MPNVILALVAVLAFAQIVPGIRETSSSTVTRPTMTGVEAGVPPTRGTFTFAAPYRTRGYRVTDPSDGVVSSVGYSYWRNLNNSTFHSQLYVVLTLDPGGPTLFAIDKSTHIVQKVGPLFPPGSPLSYASGEGWYFSDSQRTTYYVADWHELKRLNVETKAMTTVFDVRTAFGPKSYLWQAHTSANDLVHSFTVREDQNYSSLGCGVYSEPVGVFRFYSARRGDFDECQIDQTGRFLLIKEQVDGTYGEDNRLIDLRTDQETVLLDQDGATGHSDNGRNYVVGADNWANLPQLRLWRFGTAPAGPGTVVYEHPTWETSAAGHVAIATSTTVVGSNAAYQNGPRANEIIVISTDGSRRVLVVAPTMTDLTKNSAGGDYYWNLPKANVDPLGRYILWTTNLGTDRLDAVVVRIPEW